MVQEYIVIGIGIVTAAYVISAIVRAFGSRDRNKSHCPGCNSCPAYRRGKPQPLCGHK